MSVEEKKFTTPLRDELDDEYDELYIKPPTFDHIRLIAKNKGNKNCRKDQIKKSG